QQRKRDDDQRKTESPDGDRERIRVGEPNQRACKRNSEQSDEQNCGGRHSDGSISPGADRCWQLVARRLLSASPARVFSPSFQSEFSVRVLSSSSQLSDGGWVDLSLMTDNSN